MHLWQFFIYFGIKVSFSGPGSVKLPSPSGAWEESQAYKDVENAADSGRQKTSREIDSLSIQRPTSEKRNA